MMKTENIKQLLQKYFEGETNLLEEKQLRHYFLYEDIAPELAQYKILFTVFEEDKNIIAELEEEDLLPETTMRKIDWKSWTSWSAAAVILLVLGFSWFYSQTSIQNNTLSPKEIQIAQKYLSIGLESMDKGYEASSKFSEKAAIIGTQTQEIGKMEQVYQKNIEKINHVNHIDQSLEKLQNISSMKKSKLKLVM
ncbi:hypothetical protein HNS38_19890 [Lentimicrobium sp. L6]|uniref:hypothetical protein n=1 Tax=Lentimicrobium sp. L6 TaxID=2735916 RepID=UPI001556EEAD|nr:hypothetical protein [Lentimicrobium sp. L6]NPD87020.1 hypothetical protein [Lentimicrobium sp. L6]